MGDNAALLELSDIYKQYESGDGVETRVLCGVSLDLKAGETAAIMGPSGCGKSTLLNIVGTLDRASSGRVLLQGVDVSSQSDRQLSDLRNQQIGFVFQLHHLLPQCTVLENVLVPTLVSAPPESESHEQRARRLLARVGLSERLTRRPGQLSGGERQRVAVVRALINRPVLLLADEPTGSLDRKAADSLCRLLAELNAEEHVAVLMVTHARRLARTMQRVYTLEEGTLAVSS